MNPDRIIELAKAQGKSMTYICNLVQRPRSYLYGVKRSNLNIPSEYFPVFANDLGTTVEYLTWQTDDPNPVQDESVVKRKTAIRIPVLGRVPAGIPIEAIEDVLDFEELDAQVYSSDHEYFGLQIKGDSMYPRYLDGDTVIIRRQSTCDNGDDCVVYVNGYDATLKSVHFVSNGGIRLQPLNPEYSPRTYYPGDDPVSIAGVVVELRRKIKK